MQRLIIIFILFFSANLSAANATAEDIQGLLAKKNYVSAAKVGEQILREQPESADIQFLTAFAYQMNGEADKAEALYRKIMEQHPELPEPRNNLAMIYQAKGDYDAASKLLVEALETHISYATAYQNLSRIYTGIASEAYRRALSESKEPAKYTHQIQLAALSQIEPLASNPVPLEMSNMEQSAPSSTWRIDLESILNNQVKQWAEAWSNKDFATYTSFYSTEHHPDFETHRDWVEYRRQRIMRPGYIKIGVSDIQIRAQNDNRAIIDFRQSFESPTYSDRVIKRLGFRRVGNEWKIIDERVLSVL